MHTFLGNLCLTMFLSVILCLGFEMPFTRLDRLVTRGRPHRSFTSGSYKPNRNRFGSGESTNEIYRSFDDISSTLSRSYEDEIFSRYPKDDVGIIYDAAILDNSNTPSIVDESIEKNSKFHSRAVNANGYF